LTRVATQLRIAVESRQALVLLIGILLVVGWATLSGES
jgi:hypothetical protein